MCVGVGVCGWVGDAVGVGGWVWVCDAVDLAPSFLVQVVCLTDLPVSCVV